MRVLLVGPPSCRFTRNRPYSFHLGLGYVAAAARARGHEVAIYDANLPASATEPTGWRSVNEELEQALANDRHHVWTEVETVVREQAPDVVGVTVKIVDLRAAWKIAEIAKAVAPSCVTVLGGPLATTSPEVVLRSRAVDVAVRREGELTFPELLDSLAPSGPVRESVAGISYRLGDRVVHNPDRELVRDLDRLPLPAKDLLLHLDRQPEPVKRTLMGDIVTSRGCPHGCTYCANQAVWGTRRVRMRSPEAIVDEMAQLARDHGVKRFVIWDDQLTGHRKRAVELCQRLVSSGLGVRWLAFAHPNTVDAELLGLMKAAGCDEIQLGIESGCDRILRLVKKGSTVARIRRAVDAIRRSGLRWHGFFMIGFPTETREEMQQTLDLLFELRPSTAQLSVVTPYPGTDLFVGAALSGGDGEWLGADKFKTESLLVDTMPDDEFAELARDFQERVADYNISNLPLRERVAARGIRMVQRVLLRTAGQDAVERVTRLGWRVARALHS